LRRVPIVSPQSTGDGLIESTGVYWFDFFRVDGDFRF
jgi:hypothetical protein